MATEKFKLFEADIDVDGVIRKSSELKEEISKLKLEQQRLKSTVGETSEEFITNEANIKKLSTEYRNNQKIVSNLTDTNGKRLSVQQRLAIALDKEVKSINGATKNNKELKAIRNEVNVETAEGQKVIAAINEKLNQNTEIVKGNTSALEKQKINIGNYKQDVKDAIGETGAFTGTIGGAIQGVTSFTKATLAFLATPIGIVLAVVAGTLALVKEALDRSEDSTNKIKRAFAGFQGIANALFKVLEPLAGFLIDGIVKGFELAEKAVYKGIEVIASGLQLLGFDEQAKTLREFNAEVQQGAKDAKALADAEALLTKEQRKAQRIQLEYQRDAEKLRQIRDNENLSIRERIQANEELGVVLQKQLAEELRIAQLALEVANLRIEAEGETTSALDQQAEALNTIADIQERITSQQSEQLTNRVSLQREAAAAAEEAANRRIEKAQQELELLREQRRFNEKNLEEIKFFAEEEIKILDQKIKDKLISETEYQTEVLRIRNDVKQAQIDANDAELQRIQEFNERKNEIQREIDLRNIEDANQKAILKAEQDYEKQVQELEQLQLNEEQKTELLRLLTTERNQILDEINKAALEKQLQDYKTFSQAEINQRKVNAQEVAGIASQLTSILSGLLGDSIGAKLASIAVDAAVQSGLVAVTSAASQATNLAQATVVAPPPFNAPFIATALAQNASIKASSTQAITKILTASALKGLGTVAGGLKKAEDGMVLDIGGKRHSSGGTKFLGDDGTAFEAEQGEKMFILNRAASAAMGPLLSQINKRHGGNSLSMKSSYLAAGGEVIRSANAGLNLKAMEASISRAVASGSELGSMRGSMQGSMEGSRMGSAEGTRLGSAEGTYSGIVDRLENEAIEAGANF